MSEIVDKFYNIVVTPWQTLITKFVPNEIILASL